MRLKSLLLTPLLLALLVLTAGAAVAVVFFGASLAWAGTALAAAPLPVFVLIVSAGQNVARTSANLPSALLASAAGAVFATYVAASGPILPPALLAVAAFMAHLWYVFGYSRFGRTSSRTLILGERLPDFTLEDADGHVVSAEELRSGPSLILFYRGNWCPLCMAQIKEIAEGYRRLERQGVTVAMVSPQPHDETRKLSEKVDAPMRFLVDPDGRAARALDIFAEGGTPLGIDRAYGEDTVLPTVVATDASGRVIFLDQTDNYRVRPEPETFFSLFEEDAAPAAQPA